VTAISGRAVGEHVVRDDGPGIADLLLEQHSYQRPDVIVDVGGQDIKLILLKDGHVKDFMLNTQCSAGNGYFLQATAASFGIEVEQYAETAFQANRMTILKIGDSARRHNENRPCLARTRARGPSEQPQTT